MTNPAESIAMTHPNVESFEGMRWCIAAEVRRANHSGVHTLPTA